MKKRKWIILLIIVLIIGIAIGIAFSGIGREHKDKIVAKNNAEFIGEEKAEELALNQIGITRNDVQYIKTEIDKDDGVWKYEIEVRQGKFEYDLEIDAKNGEIIKYEQDRD